MNKVYPTMPGNIKPDQSRLTTLLTDTVILLCKNGLNFHNTLRIEGVLGITIDDSDVFIVHLNETVFSVVPEAANLPDISEFDDASDKIITDADSGHLEEKRVNTLSPRKIPIKAGNKISSNSRAAADGKRQIKESVSSEENSVLETKAEKRKRMADEVAERSRICIKEEEPDDCDIILTEVEDKNFAFNLRDKESAAETAKRDASSCSWSKEAGNVSLPGQAVEYGGETFSRNMTHGEQFGGVTDDWNLEAQSGTEGEAPPWQGYFWSGASYGGECLPGDSSRVQNLVTANRSGAKMRPVHDGLDQPEMERHSFTVLKPFACPVSGCNRRFYHRNNVYRHRKQKHGENVLGLSLVNRRR